MIPIRTMHPLMLVVVAVATLFAIYNQTFWGLWAEVFEGNYPSGVMFAAAFFSLCCALLGGLAFRSVLRPLIAGLFVVSAVTSYYMDELGVVIDREMIQNVVSTTWTEGKHLVTAPFVFWIAIAGIVPALVVLAVPLSRRMLWRTLWQNALFSTLCVIGFVGLLLSDMKDYASILRNRGDLKASFQPLAPVVESVRFVAMLSRSRTLPFVAIGLDAVRKKVGNVSDLPTVTVVVVGETARAQNFSLGGYGRDTNPRLAEEDILYFENVSSCGTSTAVSLPCMFSRYGRRDYSHELGVSHENVLDVIQRSGMRVEWIENNTGDKRVAARVGYRQVTYAEDPEFCGEGECIDGILVKEVAKLLPEIDQDTVLVLHQIGSHGPSYYLRYPEAFERFKPACRTANFSACTQEEVVNAYDNTILYTDKVLQDLIALLSAQDDLATAMLYVSDHGESLGENGLYLHGTPYFMAPDEQTKVPMLFWQSQAFAESVGIDDGCLKSKASAAYSHDHLFHSLLGLTAVETAERNPELDIFADCGRNG
jgi:lipid A ethanolaminephosphotransferase